MRDGAIFIEAQPGSRCIGSEDECSILACFRRPSHDPRVGIYCCASERRGLGWFMPVFLAEAPGIVVIIQTILPKKSSRTLSIPRVKPW
jgi:hypothetical protein